MGDFCRYFCILRIWDYVIFDFRELKSIPFFQKKSFDNKQLGVLTALIACARCIYYIF